MGHLIVESKVQGPKSKVQSPREQRGSVRQSLRQNWRQSPSLAARAVHLLARFSLPTRGFTAAVSVSWGTPPAKALGLA